MKAGRPVTAGTPTGWATVAKDIEQKLYDLHKPTVDLPLHCRTCVTSDNEPESWPCPTLRAVRRIIRIRAVS